MTDLEIALIAVVVVALCAWLIWWLSTRKKQVATPSAETKPSMPTEEPVAKQVAPDNLRRIEGIGPKISGLLQAAGITTFARLAETHASRLEEILHEASITIADPTTWPEQAQLAAAGEWDALNALQDELKGGRLV